MKKNIAIVGSGLVGTVLSIYLKRAGHQVTLVDRSQDIRTVKFTAKAVQRKYNLRRFVEYKHRI